jgi:hypothetical protein
MEEGVLENFVAFASTIGEGTTTKDEFGSN